MSAESTPRTRHRNRTHPSEPGACRCPAGWPVLMGTSHGEGVVVREWRHHLGQCGLPNTSGEDTTG